ncbi:MAG: alpha/beta fold hydrolase [Actinomycetota bacterium]|nr:alpha/beta fold hydrolase [Actinomycetota bacterium]
MASRRRIISRGLVLVLALGLLLGAALTAAMAKPLNPGNSPDQRLVEYRIDIPAGDHVIPAILAVPKAGGPNAGHPGVLMVHGFASQKDEVGDMYKREARYLAVAGYASLRIDFAGSGESAQPETANSFDGMVADTRTALDWFIDHSATDDDRVGILGFSLGSRIAATVAGTDDRIAAFANWSGAVENGTDGWEDLFDTYYDEAEANGSVVVDLGWRTIELSIEWFDTMAASHALDDVAGYYGPLLAIAGEDDMSVDPIVSRQLILNAGSLDAMLRILPGADHIYHVLGPDQTLAEQVMLLTAEWFADKL